jgi:thiol:disulfide interchange protein
MPHSRLFSHLALFACAFVACAAATVGRADEPIKINPLLFEQPGFDFGAADDEPEITVTLTPSNAKPGDEVTLAVKLTIPVGSYSYSVNPKLLGSTKIIVGETVGLEAVGKKTFTPDHAPKALFDEMLEQQVEKHLGDVTWKRVFRIRSDADLSQVAVSGTIQLQVCNKRRCLPIKQTINVALQSDTSDPGNKVATPPVTFVHEETPDFRGRPGSATVRIGISPTDAKPGDRVTLAVSITVKEGWHTYSITQKKGPGGLPTTIDLKQLKGLVPIGDNWEADAVPEEKTLKVADEDRILELHHGTIRWTREFRVADDAKSYGVGGRVQYMTCDEEKCLPPKRIAFGLGDLRGAATVSITSNGNPVAKTDTKLPTEFEISDADSAGGLPWFLFSAFLGGMILNIMPCVLPVLAIKVMSFVQQAGESRGRILTLNLSYVGGVILVFLILASLAVGVGLGWGGLFQNSTFNLVMACVIFAMGLSLLGVFELPVPGFVGASAGGQQREGLTGAFMTGILATLLATPCSGPFLGATLGWSVRQSPAIVYLVWTTMGLGMAFPYVVFGLFPHAIKWLPKPGNWMVRMKEFAGFILMGTVIFFIYFMQQAYVVPLLIMLLGIGLALWMVGNLYDVTSPKKHKMTVRITSFALATVICGFGYSMTNTGVDTAELPWEEFSEAKLEAALAENKTVLVDFTADWCMTCKTVEKFALNTPETKRLIEQHDIVTLYADYTHQSPEIKRWLEKFDSVSVPLTVIFPGNQPNRPIVIRDVYTKTKLLKTLTAAVEAGPPTMKQASLPQSASQ